MTFGTGSSSEAINEFGKELDRLAILSEEYKLHLWRLAMAISTDAYSRGQRDPLPNKRLRNEKA